MNKAAVDLLLLAQRDKYLSLLRQVLPALQLGVMVFESSSNRESYKHAKSALQAIREALK